jgi:hypothetical protein
MQKEGLKQAINASSLPIARMLTSYAGGMKDIAFSSVTAVF